MRFSTNSFPLFFALCFIVSIQLPAQWSTNPAVNNAISTATSAQNNPTIVSDGSGGAIITWTDYRSGGTSDIYAQYINASGSVQWTTDGVAICTAAADQSKPTIVSDGSGGAIITWYDYRSGTSWDIYTQRINASGTVQWTANGVVISTAANEQYEPTITSDGTGGAIITWTDYRNGLSDIYAQRINASGTVQWTGDGVAICTTTSDQSTPTIVSDGSGGAIITWYDYRSGTSWDIYTQRINTSGTVQWTTNGVAICTASGTQAEPTIVGDGAGGAIITWYDNRSGNYDIYAQRISVSGIVQWTANGVAICNATSTQTTPTIDNDGTGGAIITWQDFRSAVDIYTQRINASGVVQWTANGVAICTATGTQTTPKIVSDGSGGAIITWYDYRNDNYDIYAQRINTSGVIQWVADGVAISRAASSQDYPTIVGDGTGGAIITWKDSRSGTSDIYAQRIDRFGNFNPAPWIDKVGDIANDQGGKLRIFWKPSSLDIWGNTSVKSYTIKLGARTTGILGKTSQSNGTGIYWQTAGLITADWSEGYTTTVSTYADSGLQGTPTYYFQVIAKNSDSTVWWYSNIDSGYSIDNIPPVGVSNALIASNGAGIMLKWGKNRVDKDLMEYRIYRSTFPAFPVSSGTLLSTTTDTSYTDASGTNGTSYFYRIAAMDVHGNLGAPSSELNETALSLELTSFIVSPDRNNATIEWSVASETNSFGYDIERRESDNGRPVPNEWKRTGFVEVSGTSQSSRHYSYSDKNVGTGTFAYRLKQIDRNGQYKYSMAIEITTGIAPNEFELSQNYPNPFNPETTIEFTVPQTGRATLIVFNAIGQEVATLYDREAEAGKYHQVKFNASDAAAGLYFSRLEFGGKIQIQKMLLIK